MSLSSRKESAKFMMTEWKFKRDTAFRKQFFVPESFAHPAKMDAQLLIRIVETYTEPGETILDPMAGSGTTMLACTLGRNVILLELEEKFVKMCRDNWEQVKMRPQLGSVMGTCQIIQGDARQLEGLLVDKCIFSPPFSETLYGSNQTPFFDKLSKQKGSKRFGRKVDTSRIDEGKYSKDPDNIGNLPYGAIDKIVTSPPYAEAQSGGGIAQKGYQGDKHSPIDLVGKRSYIPENIGNSEEQIGNLPYGEIDKIITSPPYEGSEIVPGMQTVRREGLSLTRPEAGEGYNRQNPDNIGNLKQDTYLQAMLQVYRSCFSVLKSGGLMILVTKNFIRNKQVIRLDLDTIKLCEQAGFSFVHRRHRKLPAQSFWRIIYYQKHPDVPVIDKEDILVFRKRSNGKSDS
jgi:DNA modification methylase